MELLGALFVLISLVPFMYILALIYSFFYWLFTIHKKENAFARVIIDNTKPKKKTNYRHRNTSEGDF